jgi:GntR family transcriptional regulator
MIQFRREVRVLISFAEFQMEDGTPIYLQIIVYLKRGMVAGKIHDGDPLPSRRNLSALLGVNPNTIQKAYHMLEEEGLISSQSGAKSTVSLDVQKLAKVRKDLLDSDLCTVIGALKQAGLSRENALKLIRDNWD